MKYGKVTDRLAGARRYFLLRTGLVYTRVEICEYIPDSVEHAAMTPNVEDETAETVEYVHLRLPDGSTIQQRPYPIYYWFKIFFDRTGKKKRSIIIMIAQSILISHLNRQTYTL